MPPLKGLGIAVALAAVFLCVLTGLTRGQELSQFGDFGFGHAEYHHFFQHGEPRADGSPGPVMRPHQPNVPCCGEDCRPTKVRNRFGVMEVWLDRKWRVVPPERVKNIPTPHGLTFACASRPFSDGTLEIYCVMPGKPGG